jgi:hypothetical protein
MEDRHETICKHFKTLDRNLFQGTMAAATQMYWKKIMKPFRHY